MIISNMITSDIDVEEKKRKLNYSATTKKNHTHISISLNI